MCLERCGKEVREQVTLYLQQTPHSAHQPLLLLLEGQVLKVKQECTSQQQKDVILIAQHMKSESQQMPSTHHEHHEEISSFKRRRESMSHDEESADLNMLISSLSRSFFLVRKIKENSVFVDDEESIKIKAIIEGMLHIWDTGEPTVTDVDIDSNAL